MAALSPRRQRGVQTGAKRGRMTPVIFSLLRSVAILAFIILSAALAFSFLGAFSPLADSVAHFRLHLLFALGGVCALLLALGKRFLASASALGILALIGVGLDPALPGEPLSGRPAELTLLQLNLLHRNSDHRAVLALIEREKPDVIALQEVSDANRSLLAALDETYPHQSVCPFAGVGAVAVLSRFPRAGGGSTIGGVQGCFKGRGLTWMRVATPKGPLTVGSIHLHWPYPFQQRPQVEDIAASLKGVARPMLIGGDFNAAPWSYSPNRIARDAGSRVLGGLRFTFYFSWRGRTLPIGMPIDHVLADPTLRPVQVSVSEPVGSDHRAVIARLSWTK